MHTTQVVRRARVAAGVALLVAGFVGVPAAQRLPLVHSLDELARFLLLAGISSLGPATGALIGCFAPDRAHATRRTLTFARALTGAPPLILGLAGDGLDFWVVFACATCVWGVAAAAPTLPLVYAVVEATARPSVDSLDRVYAMAFGLWAAVKLPEAVTAYRVWRHLALPVTVSLGIVGLIGFAIFQQRRRKRRSHVRQLLEHPSAGTRFVPAQPSHGAPVLSGAPLLAVVRPASSPSYRDAGQEVVDVIPEAAIWPDVRTDLRRLGIATGIALLLSLIAAWLSSFLTVRT